MLNYSIEPLLLQHCYTTHMHDHEHFIPIVSGFLFIYRALTIHQYIVGRIQISRHLLATVATEFLVRLIHSVYQDDLLLLLLFWSRPLRQLNNLEFE